VLAAVIVAAVIVAGCLEVPQIAWLALLAAALVLLDVALGLGIRQWLRG
jgi:outer membrane murein-binding lipoprotein Lpp